MSSYIVSEGTMDVIVTEICKRRPHDRAQHIKEEIMKIARESQVDGESIENAVAFILYGMNETAVYARYNSSMEVSEYEHRTVNASMEQVLKSLENFKYQCHEGSVPEDKLYKLIEGLEFQITKILLNMHCELYREAQWDISREHINSPKMVKS